MPGIHDNLYRITTDYGVGGVIIANGKVARSAPIFRWMKGKTLTEITAWVESKNGTIEPVD